MTTTYSALVHGAEGAASLDFDSGSSLNVNSGATATIAGTIDITGNLKYDGVAVATAVTFSAAAGSSNVCEVTITVKDNAGTTIAKPHTLELWLSDTAGGVHTATTASGSVGMKASNGVDLSTYVSKKHLLVFTTASGTGILSITDSSKTGFYVNARINGKVSTSSQLITGNYG